MARLDLGFDLDKAGWPSTPGPSAALDIVSQAEAVHARTASMRAVVAAERETMERFGRALFESLTKGEIEPESLPSSVRDVLPATAQGPSGRQG